MRQCGEVSGEHSRQCSLRNNAVLVTLPRPAALAPPTHPRQADGAAAYMKQQIALGRIGTAEEAAGAMLMLASPYASYISGQSIEVTGGGWL